jgi:hypothetical protein
METDRYDGASLNLKEISAEGNTLLRKYEPSEKDGGGRISQYLQHCTEKRIDPKDWPVCQMMDEIEPTFGRCGEAS